uniref:GDSL-type esterase/lipase family protein n=1 Tax=uncultured Kocuria sp. TaxID=259305 RepID=UPI00261265B2
DLTVTAPSSGTTSKATALHHYAGLNSPAVGEDEQNDRIKATNTAMREEAERLIVPFVDCFEATSTNALWRRQVSAGDGYHPDAAGYELLAQTVTTPVLDWLNSPSNHSPLVQSQ